MEDFTLDKELEIFNNSKLGDTQGIEWGDYNLLDNQGKIKLGDNEIILSLSNTTSDIIKVTKEQLKTYSMPYLKDLDEFERMWDHLYDYDRRSGTISDLDLENLLYDNYEYRPWNQDWDGTILENINKDDPLSRDNLLKTAEKNNWSYNKVIDELRDIVGRNNLDITDGDLEGIVMGFYLLNDKENKLYESNGSKTMRKPKKENRDKLIKAVNVWSGAGYFTHKVEIEPTASPEHALELAVAKLTREDELHLAGFITDEDLYNEFEHDKKLDLGLRDLSSVDEYADYLGLIYVDASQEDGAVGYINGENLRFLEENTRIKRENISDVEMEQADYEIQILIDNYTDEDLRDMLENVRYNRDLDESGAGGFWDEGGDIANDVNSIYALSDEDFETLWSLAYEYLWADAGSRFGEDDMYIQYVLHNYEPEATDVEPDEFPGTATVTIKDANGLIDETFVMYVEFDPKYKDVSVEWAQWIFGQGRDDKIRKAVMEDDNFYDYASSEAVQAAEAAGIVKQTDTSWALGDSQTKTKAEAHSTGSVDEENLRFLEENTRGVGQHDNLVKDWYQKEFPEDEVGETLDPLTTFREVMDYINYPGSYGSGVDLYDVLGGRADSVVRERVFTKLTEIYGTTYDNIYDAWLYAEDF